MEHHRDYNAQEIRPGIWRHSHRHEPITTPERDAHEHEHVRGPAAEIVAVPDHHDPAWQRRPDPDRFAHHHAAAYDRDVT